MEQQLARRRLDEGRWPARRPRALLVDVGFTLTAYDGGRIAALARQAGLEVSAAGLEAAEPQIRAELAQHAWPQSPDAQVPASGGARFMRRLLEVGGGAGAAALDRAATHVWDEHLRRNVWARVLGGVPEALDRLRAAGVRLAVVSNSEGNVEALLEDVGLRAPFDVVVDSWHAGFAKPDPRIFALALDGLGVAPSDALMVGDSPVADLAGAAAAGVAGALIDPCGLHPDAAAPRFPTFAAFAAAVSSAPPAGEPLDR